MAPSRAARTRTGRQEKAAVTRGRMRDAARELFTAEGYTATSMERIARRAGVAVQTVYYTFGTKLALLTELVDTAVAGDDEPIPTLDRPWVAEAVAAPPRRQIRIQVDAARQISERAAPVLDALRGAATAEPEAARLWRANRDQVHTVQRHLVDTLAGKGGLRAGLDPATATDIAVTVLGIDTYLTLVVERGWAPAAWQHWAADVLIQQLLPGTDKEADHD